MTVVAVVHTDDATRGLYYTVLLDAAGRPHAAMGAAAMRLGRDVAALDFKLLTPHLLKRDLPPPTCLISPQP